MLKYHLLVSNKNKQKLGTFNHYLTLGSHQSPYLLQNVQAFSIITLNPKEKLPAISNNVEGKFVTLAVLLKGKLRVDGKIYQPSPQLNQNVLRNPVDISTVDDEQAGATFAYIVLKGEPKQSPLLFKRFAQTTTITIDKSLLFVIEGKLIYKQEETEITVKNKANFEDPPALFYTSKKLEATVEKDSLIIMLTDRL